MARGLKVTRSKTSPTNHKHLRGFRLRIDAVDPVGGMTQFVFVHRRHPKSPYDGTVFDEFCTVASVTHLADIPEGAPNLPFPFFRKTFVEMDARSEQDAEEFWDLMNSLVCSLLTALDGLDDLVLQETIICGEEGEVTDSISLSEGVSEGVSESVSLSEGVSESL